MCLRASARACTRKQNPAPNAHNHERLQGIDLKGLRVFADCAAQVRPESRDLRKTNKHNVLAITDR